MPGNESLAFSNLRTKRSYKRLHMSKETQDVISKIDKQIAACDEAIAKAQATAKRHGDDVEDYEEYKENRSKADDLHRTERLHRLVSCLGERFDS